ncbi:hypothetical protein PAHAL_5G378300 [Panicum hallii]|uniref:Uncharacterized protein n=1 Tax=Panicum hallii TaxID=206008 RepID=A0A2S3HUV4_9POAL|nr:hypothetical protein PAHAL_5G378300 [Panicum hallii]
MILVGRSDLAWLLVDPIIISSPSPFPNVNSGGGGGGGDDGAALGSRRTTSLPPPSRRRHRPPGCSPSSHAPPSGCPWIRYLHQGRMDRGGSLKPWFGKVGCSNLVVMMLAVWISLVLEDSGLAWSGGDNIYY